MAGTEAPWPHCRKLVELPDDSMRLLADERASAQLIRYADRMHLRLVAMQPARGQRGDSPNAALPESAPIDVVVARNTVVTVHAGEIAAFDAFLGHIRGRHTARPPGCRELSERPGRLGAGGVPGVGGDDRAPDRRARRDRHPFQRGSHVPGGGRAAAATRRRPAPCAGAASLGLRTAGQAGLRGRRAGQAMARHRRPPGSHHRSRRKRARAPDRRVRRVHGDIGASAPTTS